MIHRPGRPRVRGRLRGRRAPRAARAKIPFAEILLRRTGACSFSTPFLSSARVLPDARRGGNLRATLPRDSRARASPRARASRSSSWERGAQRRRGASWRLCSLIQNELKYVPVDISPAALEAGAQRAHTGLRGPGSFGLRVGLRRGAAAARGRVAQRASERSRAFLGSNVGNFDREGAREFLSKVRRVTARGRQRCCSGRT